MSVSFASFDEWLPHILPHVPGCPEMVAVQEIRNAAIRLCADSTVWREDIPAGDLVADTPEYLIIPPGGTEIVNIHYVYLDGDPIEAATAEQLDSTDYGWRDIASGTPTKFFVPTPGRFKFNRSPESTITDGLTVRVSLKPSVGSSQVGQIIWRDFREALERGALRNLMIMPDKPWSNPDLADYHGRYFTFQIQRARARASLGFTPGPIVAKRRQWV